MEIVETTASFLTLEDQDICGYNCLFYHGFSSDLAKVLLSTILAKFLLSPDAGSAIADRWATGISSFPSFLLLLYPLLLFFSLVFSVVTSIP